MTPPNQSLEPTADHSMHTYEIRPRKDHRGFDLISDALHSRLWYTFNLPSLPVDTLEARQYFTAARVCERR